MKLLKNKKGFTLVELLAVIVILALIMSIAIISMSGIMQSARYSTMKETGVQIINGVRQEFTLNSEYSADFINSPTGYDYYFTSNLLEKGGKTSPLGGEFKYYAVPSTLPETIKKIGSGNLYRSTTQLTCSNSSDENYSFVRVKYDENAKNPVYSICLTAGAGNYYINLGSESKLLDSSDNSMIQK